MAKRTGKQSLQPVGIEPKTKNQRLAFDAFRRGMNLLLHGCAGTGKTFIACALMLEFYTGGEAREWGVDHIKIIRSAVPTRDMGFLPGDAKEKAALFEAPYSGAFCDILENREAYERLRADGIVDFETTSYLRGTTIDRAVVLVDEIQNMNEHEFETVITRLGENTRVILSGDTRQSDLVNHAERDGIKRFLPIIHKMESFVTIDFTIDDVVRSQIVKDYLRAKGVPED